ncbi:MAG: hypothetical protein ABR912_01845 [Terracidiphilus sp.]
MSVKHGVTERLYQPRAPIVEGQNDGALDLVNHPIDAFRPVGTQNLVLAQPHAAVAIDLAA